MTDMEAVKNLIAAGRYEEANALVNLFRLEQEERKAAALELIAHRLEQLHDRIDMHWNLGDTR